MNKKQLLTKCKHFFESPKTSLATGIILLVAGILESTESFIEGLLGIEVRVTHGIIIFALGHIFIAIIHIVEGMENIEISQLEEEIQEKK